MFKAHSSDVDLFTSPDLSNFFLNPEEGNAFGRTSLLPRYEDNFGTNYDLMAESEVLRNPESNDLNFGCPLDFSLQMSQEEEQPSLNQAREVSDSEIDEIYGIVDDSCKLAKHLVVRDEDDEDKISVDSMTTAHMTKQTSATTITAFSERAPEVGEEEKADLTILPPAKKRGRKKAKLFTRRKDVILKTLLRKCRKYIQKDFNSKTNYLKRKRTMDTGFYKACLLNYLAEELQVYPDEKLVIFCGCLIYQQDLQKEIDTFVSPHFDSASIKSTMDEIHEILYRYSHEKFREFTNSHNAEFNPIFSHYSQNGSATEMSDKEYAAGFKIIEQLTHC